MTDERKQEESQGELPGEIAWKIKHSYKKFVSVKCSLERSQLFCNYRLDRTNKIRLGVLDGDLSLREMSPLTCGIHRLRRQTGSQSTQLICL